MSRQGPLQSSTADLVRRRTEIATTRLEHLCVTPRSSGAYEAPGVEILTYLALQIVVPFVVGVLSSLTATEIVSRKRNLRSSTELLTWVETFDPADAPRNLPTELLVEEAISDVTVLGMSRDGAAALVREIHRDIRIEIESRPESGERPSL